MISLNTLVLLNGKGQHPSKHIKAPPFNNNSLNYEVHMVPCKLIFGNVKKSMPKVLFVESSSSGGY